MKRLFSKEDDMYILDHYQTTPYATLAEHFGLTERQVRGHINNMGLRRVSKKTERILTSLIQKKKHTGLVFYLLTAGSIPIVKHGHIVLVLSYTKMILRF